MIEIDNGGQYHELSKSTILAGTPVLEKFNMMMYNEQQQDMLKGILEEGLDEEGQLY